MEPKTVDDYWHSFSDGNEVRPDSGNGAVLGKCPISGEYFQHAYTDRSRPGYANACHGCGDDKVFSVGERLANLEDSRS